MTLKVGIAGYGVVGERRRHFIDLHSNLKTVAVCDKVFPDSGRFDDGVVYHPNYLQLLNEDLDILFVCLTNDVAAEVTVAGLQHGLHVFCEKPPGRDLDDIARVIACEKEHPELRLMYGFNHRYHLAVRDAMEIIDSGELGKVVNMKGTYGKSKIINFDSDWRTKRSIAGGGILLDQGIHMVDLMRLFAGDFTDINSYVTNDFWGHDVEDNAYALMRTDDGVVAFLHSTATQWRHRFNLDITLEKGGLILEGILSGTKSYGAETLTVIAKGEDDMGDPRETMTRYNEDPSWVDEIGGFADTILSGEPVTDGSSLEAWKTMELVYQIYCSDPQWQTQFGLKDTTDIAF